VAEYGTEEAGEIQTEDVRQHIADQNAKFGLEKADEMRSESVKQGLKRKRAAQAAELGEEVASYDGRYGELSASGFVDYKGFQQWCNDVDGKVTTASDFKLKKQGGGRPDWIPSSPDREYKGKGWTGWPAATALANAGLARRTTACITRRV
jgi:hypothetical protein